VASTSGKQPIRVVNSSSTGFTVYYSGVSPAYTGLTPDLIGRRQGVSIHKTGSICEGIRELPTCFSLFMVTVFGNENKRFCFISKIFSNPYLYFLRFLLTLARSYLN